MLNCNSVPEKSFNEHWTFTCWENGGCLSPANFFYLSVSKHIFHPSLVLSSVVCGLLLKWVFDLLYEWMTKLYVTKKTQLCILSDSIQVFFSFVLMHHTGDVIYISANSFTPYLWSTGGYDAPRNAAKHQQRQRKRRLWANKHGSKNVSKITKQIKVRGPLFTSGTVLQH